MINRLMATKLKKKQKLRNNEYYDTQQIFDDLYHKSKNKNNYKFYKLMDLITDERNIELAYRNIKKNTGSKTSGTNGHTIEDLARITNGDFVKYARNRLQNYQPQEIRRVNIPKGNGKTRPLGIPTIEDRIIQQSILQILEPICEGKFYNHNYGFRPNRGTQHAIARAMFLANKSKLHYVLDIDIKGFFDNVNHSKLLKQMWSLGIQDKQLLCIISKMLKAPIKDVGVPTKGTPQGGILSPLLSNIVLNELDWWIANQWEFFKTETQYSFKRDNRIDNSYKYKVQRKTKLKEMYIVRYADDFKIFCKDYKSATRIFHATKQWLKERLGLEISEEKSKIVNLRTNYSEYLGIKMKLFNKGNKQVIRSHVSDKAKTNIQNNIKTQIKKIQKQTTINSINKYNAMVLGMHNYYKIATNVNLDFANLAYILNKSILNRTKCIKSKTGIKSECYNKFYGKYKIKTIYLKGIALFPLNGITTQTQLGFSQDICNYTKKGREKIHQIQKGVSPFMVEYLMKHPISAESIEYNDNRISLYIGQNGICSITGEPLEIGDMECHHKTPKMCGGSDEYSNLIFLRKNIHKLIHATDLNTIEKYAKQFILKPMMLKKLNKLRTLVGNFEI
ncbi:MAG: group II intron reverse transcriptase/maturase [Paraclostridium sp.]